MKKDKIIIIAGVLSIIIFAAGIYHLFVLRFQTGDIYPVYSTMRIDPLGASVFYESLDGLKQVKVAQNFNNIFSLNPKPKTTVFIIGTDFFWISNSKLVKKFKELALSGNRIIFSFYNIFSRPVIHYRNYGNNQDKTNQKKNDENDTVPDVIADSDTDYFLKNLGFSLKYDTSINKIYSVIAKRYSDGIPVPETIPVYTSLCFSSLDTAWETIYSNGTFPVIIERTYGSGSFVFSASTYFFSNEFLRKQDEAGLGRSSQNDMEYEDKLSVRTDSIKNNTSVNDIKRSESPIDLLVWLIKNNRNIVFDETHHQIMKQRGIVFLMRKYKLGSIFTGLLVIALLFVWKNSFGFISPEENIKENENLRHTGSFSGLTNLLKQNIKSDDLLSICFREWKEFHRKHTYNKDRFRKTAEGVEDIIQQNYLLPKKNRDTVKTYRKICSYLHGKKQ